MGDEILDVVDEKDRVVGRAGRNEIHARKLPHRSTHLLIFNSKEEVFIQKRSVTKDEFPGKWGSSVSGHVDSGEGYDECIIREAKEEVGLDLHRVPERIFKIDPCEENSHEFSWVYRFVCEGPFQLNEEEISDGRWFSLDEVEALLRGDPESFAPPFTLIWRVFSENASR